MVTIKQIGLLTFLLSLSLTSCEKIDLPEGTPKCIKQKIRKLKGEDCPSVQTVYRYDFQGQTVYLFNPKNCGNDLTSEVVNNDCENICFLGGVSGNSNCNGDDFYTEAKNEKLIWEEDS